MRRTRKGRRSARARTARSRTRSSLIELEIPVPSTIERNKRQEEKMGRNILGFVLAFVAGIFATIQGYQAITGTTVTGNVIGVSMAATSSIAIIIGVLIIAGSYLMVVSETTRFGGILTVILGVLSAIVTLGASIVPALIAIAGGFLGMTAE